MWDGKNMFGHQRSLVVAALAVAAGCTGVVGKVASGTGGGTSTGPGGGGTGTGGSNSTGTGTGTGGATAAGDAGTSNINAGQLGSVPAGPLDTGRVTMRRLNVREYDNTARDLLGTTQTLAANNFPGDNVDDGFDTVGAALSYSEELLGDEFAAASTLVTELMSRTKTDPLYTAVFSCAPTATNL